MASLGVLLILAFAAGIYTAPDTKPPLDVSTSTLIISNEDANTKQLDDVVEVIIQKFASNDTDGAEKSFKDLIDKAVKAEPRVSDPSVVDDTGEDAETKEIRNVLKHVLRKIAKDGKVAEKKIREILETAANTGQLDRGFVSDLINSTLGGVHMGLSLGNTNGTTNQLCIKLGNIVMTGCRRTVAKVTTTDHNRTVINTEREARMARRSSTRYRPLLSRSQKKKLKKHAINILTDIADELLERRRQAAAEAEAQDDFYL